MSPKITDILLLSTRESHAVLNIKQVSQITLRRDSYGGDRGILPSHLSVFLLVGISTLVLFLKVLIVYSIQHVGYGDSAAYATMASSLSRGEGLSVGYIGSFYEKYDDIVRPEDHWPPLYSFVISPLFWLFGDSVALAKLPTLLISSLGLPLVAYSLTKSLGGSRWASLGSGLTILLYPLLFKSSLEIMADISYTFVFCLAILFFIKGSQEIIRKPQSSKSGDGNWFLFMGSLLGISYYGKGIALVMLPVFFVAYVFVTQRLKFDSRDKKFLFGMLIAVSMVTPWWVRNYILFNDPLFSTQSYMSGLQGYGEGNSLYVYWDSDVKPSFFTTKLGLGISCVVDKTLGHVREIFRLIFLVNKPNLELPRYPVERWGTEVLVFGIPALFGFFFCWKDRVITIIPLTIFTAILFLSVFWSPIDRLVFPFVLLVTALGWSVWSVLITKICRWVSRRLGNKRRTDAVAVSNAILIIFGIGVFVDNAMANYVIWTEATKAQIYPYADNTEVRDRLVVAKWLNENTSEDAVIMDYEPWDLHYHSNRKTVSIPYGTIERISEVAQEYRVTHLTFYDRKSLGPLFSGEVKGLKLVYYPGRYKDYVEKYPDLKIVAYEETNKALERDVALERWGKLHYEAKGEKERRILPQHGDKVEGNGLGVWELTEAYWRNKTFPKTIDIGWNYDVCR